MCSRSRDRRETRSAFSRSAWSSCSIYPNRKDVVSKVDFTTSAGRAIRSVDFIGDKEKVFLKILEECHIIIPSYHHKLVFTRSKGQQIERLFRLDHKYNDLPCYLDMSSSMFSFIAFESENGPDSESVDECFCSDGRPDGGLWSAAALFRASSIIALRALESPVLLVFA